MGLWRLHTMAPTSSAHGSERASTGDADAAAEATAGREGVESAESGAVARPCGCHKITRFSVRRADIEERRGAICVCGEKASGGMGLTSRATTFVQWVTLLTREQDPRIYQRWRGNDQDMGDEGLVSARSELEGLLQKGVPPSLRGRVWWTCSGAAEKRKAASPLETYPSLVRRSPLLSKCAAMEIEKDLPRTFSHTVYNNPDRHARATTIGELRRVLQAYSLRNPVVGYCQSMNFLAAVLLQHLEEEEAFWVLVAMVEDLIPQFHTRNMLGSRTEQKVLTELVLQEMPRLHGHLEDVGMDLEPFTLKWFLCLYLHTLPYDVALRVWDRFFCEGSHVLLRVGLVLLKITQSQLLACNDVIDMYEVFKFSHDNLLTLTAPYRRDRRFVDEDVGATLMRLAMDPATSFIGTISLDALQGLRQYYRNEVVAELKQLVEARGSKARSDSVYANLLQEEETSEAGLYRHIEAAQEMADYDFVEEYAYYCEDISPTKHIHFADLYDSVDATNMFVDVEYDGPMFHVPSTGEV